MNKEPILFLASHASRPGTDPGEGWDAVMVCAAFDRRTTVLLLDDGVRLLAGVSGEGLVAAMDAGLEAIHVDAEAFAKEFRATPPARQAREPNSALRFTTIDRTAMRALIETHTTVISL